MEDNINKLVVGYVDKTSRIFLVSSIAFKDSLTDLEVTYFYYFELLFFIKEFLCIC